MIGKELFPHICTASCWQKAGAKHGCGSGDAMRKLLVTE